MLMIKKNKVNIIQIFTIHFSANTTRNLFMCMHIIGFLKILFIYFLEWEEGKEKEERNVSVWVSLVCPLLGTWPATQACALTGNQWATLWFTGQSSIHWATPARAHIIYNKWDHTISNIVISVYGVRWVVDLSGWTLWMLQKYLIIMLYIGI